MNIQDIIEQIDAHSREIEKLKTERVELERADLPRDAHNRELNQIVGFLEKETKAREEREKIVRAYNTMKDNIEAIQRISDIPAKDFYERDEKERELEARREEIKKAREILPPELVQSLHEEIIRARENSENAVVTTKEVAELEEEISQKGITVEDNIDNIEEVSNEAPEKQQETKEKEEKDNEYVEIVPESEFIKIQEIEVDMNAIKEEYIDVEKEIIGYIQANNGKLNGLNLHKERLEEAKAAIGINEENKVELEKEYDRQIAETERAIRAITNPSKEDQIRIRSEKDVLYRLATSKIQKIEQIISDLKAENRRLEYEHSEMVHNGIEDHAKWHHLTNKINDNTYKIRMLNEMIEKYKGLKEELRKTEKVINLSPEKEITKGGSTGSGTGDNSGDGTTGGDDSTGDDSTGDDTDDIEPEDDKKVTPTFDNAIEEIKKKLNPELLPPEVLKDLISKLSQLVLMKYEQEQAIFENELASAKTVQEKLDLIEKRETYIKVVYIRLLSHPNKEIDEMLAEERNKMDAFIVTSYNNAKSNGEYCWKEFDAIKESKEYIVSVIGNDKDWNFQLKTLFENMEDIIKNPNQEQYENWRMAMQEFAERMKLDPNKMLPYVNAKAKIINPNVSVDNEFNLHGLNLDNSKTKGTEKGNPVPPKKPRRKVKKVEDAKGFFKKHPKLKMIAIGLGILLGSQLGLAGLMMINSTLWSVLGGQGALCGILHAINLGLSKIVGVGLFQFTPAGTYTFLGKTGALALYNAVGAKLTTAAAALGGIGALIAKKIKNKNEKKTSWLKEKLKNRKWFKKRNEEEIEEEYEEELDEPENDKKMTKEQLEELKKQAEEAKKQKDAQMIMETIERLIKEKGYTKEEAMEEILKGTLEQQNDEEVEYDNDTPTRKM